MKGHGQKFTRKMHLAVTALLQAPTIEAAARRCGVSTSTLSRWVKRPEFQDVYEQARHDLVTRSLSSLQIASIEALEVFEARDPF